MTQVESTLGREGGGGCICRLGDGLLSSFADWNPPNQAGVTAPVCREGKGTDAHYVRERVGSFPCRSRSLLRQGARERAPVVTTFSLLGYLQGRYAHLRRPGV